MRKKYLQIGLILRNGMSNILKRYTAIDIYLPLLDNFIFMEYISMKTFHMHYFKFHNTNFGLRNGIVGGTA